MLVTTRNGTPRCAEALSSGVNDFCTLLHVSKAAWPPPLPVMEGGRTRDLPAPPIDIPPERERCPEPPAAAPKRDHETPRPSAHRHGDRVERVRERHHRERAQDERPSRLPLQDRPRQPFDRPARRGHG